MSARCTGHCCKAFPLVVGGRPIRTLAELLARGTPEAEARQVAGMALPLLEREQGRQLYTCRFFNGADCTIYDQRPGMCRRFGLDGRCPYPDCTFKGEDHGQARD